MNRCSELLNGTSLKLPLLTAPMSTRPSYLQYISSNLATPLRLWGLSGVETRLAISLFSTPCITQVRLCISWLVGEIYGQRDLKYCMRTDVDQNSLESTLRLKYFCENQSVLLILGEG